MSILGIAFVAISTAVACAAAFVWWRFSYWRRRGIPYLPPRFPYGNTKDAILGIRPFAIAMDDIYQRVKAHPYAGIFKSLQPALMVTDLDLIRDIMVRDALTHFVNRVPQPDTKRDVIFGKTVFAANSAHWRIVRSSISPAFSSGKMKMIFPFLQKKRRVLIDKLDEIASQPDPRVDMKLIFAQLTTDFIANSAFGIETNSLNDPGNEFLKNGMKIVEKTTRRYFNTVMVFQYPSLVKFTRSVFLTEDVQNFFRHLVWGVVNDREKKSYTRGDFLDLLIQLKNKGKIQTDEEERGEGVAEESNPRSQDFIFISEDGCRAESSRNVGPDPLHHPDGNPRNISVIFTGKAPMLSCQVFDGDDLVAHAFVFYFAGFETSSTAMNFALLELAANQDCQEKLIEEIDDTFEEEGEISYEALHSMKYLDMVVNETLRKYPVLAIVDRVCTKEYHNPKFNLTIPKGVEVLIPVYSMQRDPRYYPNPDKFDPERFSDKSKLTNYTFMPFGEGPRNCIGMRLGIMQVKMGIVSALTKFRFHLPKELEGMKSPPLEKRSFLVSPEDNLRLIIRRRAHKNSKAQLESGNDVTMNLSNGSNNFTTEKNLPLT